MLTTTPTPADFNKSIIPALSIASPTHKNNRRIVPVPLGAFALASAAGGLVTSLDLKKCAPRGGKLLGIDALITAGGTGAGASTSITASLDGTPITSLARTITLAQAVLGAVLGFDAPTALNTFTSATGLLTLTYAVGTVFTAGSVKLIAYVEVNEDNGIETGVFGRHLVPRGGMLEAWLGNIGTLGTAGSTVVRARKNGTPITGATATIAYDASSGKFVLPCGVEVAAGDLLDLEVTTAPTGGAQLDAAPVISQIFDGTRV